MNTRPLLRKLIIRGRIHQLLLLKSLVVKKVYRALLNIQWTSKLKVRLQAYLNPQVEMELWTLLKIHQNARTLNLFSYIETDLTELQTLCQNDSTFFSTQTISTNRSAITKYRKLKIVVERFKKEIFLFKWVQIWDLGMVQAQSYCC